MQALITNVQSRQGKTHATFGLRCEIGKERYFGDLGAWAEREVEGAWCWLIGDVMDCVCMYNKLTAFRPRLIREDRDLTARLACVFTGIRSHVHERM